MAERNRSPTRHSRHRAPENGASKREREGAPSRRRRISYTSSGPRPRSDARAVPRGRRPSHPSTAMPRAPARPRRPARPRSPGLNRASSSGSSSARTRLRGMLTSAFDSSSTNGSAARARDTSGARARRQSSSGRTMSPFRGCIAAEPARARAAQQPQQKRLGLVVARVAERDDVGAGNASARARRNAWRAARAGVLDRAPLAARARRDIAAVRRAAARRAIRRERRDRTARRRPPRRAADG